MINNIKLFFKGFIIGIANIIPGVSGGTLAISLGIYEKLIKILSNLFQDFKENLKFLIPIILGAVSSLLILSKLINYCLNKFEIQTILFFIGLIIGGIPLITRKAKVKKIKIRYIISFLVPFIFIISLIFLNNGFSNVDLNKINALDALMLFFVGVIAAATMIIPGISGSFVLMLLGYYKPIIKIISDLTNFSHLYHNMLILIPLAIGILIGIVLVSKLINYLLKKHEKVTYFAILGFIFSSIVSIVINITSFTLIGFAVGLLFMALGFVITYKISE